MSTKKLTLIIALVSIFLIGTIVCLAIIIDFKPRKEPKQVVYDEILSKRWSYSHSTKGGTTTERFVTFLFPNGDEKELKITGDGKREIYESLQEGDTGMLTYKELEEDNRFGSKFFADWSFRYFVSFEKDEQPS